MRLHFTVTCELLVVLLSNAVAIMQNSFSLLGESVGVEYCKQRKGSEKEVFKDHDGDWTCFKVPIVCLLAAATSVLISCSVVL